MSLEQEEDQRAAQGDRAPHSTHRRNDFDTGKVRDSATSMEVFFPIKGKGGGGGGIRSGTPLEEKVDGEISGPCKLLEKFLLRRVHTHSRPVSAAAVVRSTTPTTPWPNGSSFLFQFPPKKLEKFRASSLVWSLSLSQSHLLGPWTRKFQRFFSHSFAIERKQKMKLRKKEEERLFDRISLDDGPGPNFFSLY